MSRWVVSALLEGHGFAYAEPDEAASLGSVSAALADTGLNLDRAHADGRLLRVPMTEFYTVDGPEMLVGRARSQGFSGLSIVADPGLGLHVLDRSGYMAFERRLATSCVSGPLSALCQFTADTVGLWFADVSRLHTGTGMTTPFLAVRLADGVALFGEADISTEAAMSDALRAAADLAAGVLPVDLTGLSLLTAAGCRALIEATDGFREAGGHVLLLGPQPPVERVLRLVGFDQAPGFTIAWEPR